MEISSSGSSSTATGDTACSSADHRGDREYAVNQDLATERGQRSKIVKLPKDLAQPKRTMQILVRDDTSNVTVLQHAGPNTYGQFSNQQADKFVETIQKNVTFATQTVDLLGCHVDRTFAVMVEQCLQRQHPKVKVRVLVDDPRGTAGLYDLEIFNKGKEFQVRHHDTGLELTKPILDLDNYLTSPQNLHRS